MRLLVLGGSAEATALARRLAERSDVEAVLSLAGATRNPAVPPVPFRVGGFGGASGLQAYLTLAQIDAVVDATHPFAAQISANAGQACRRLDLPFSILTRPPWRQQAGDRWTCVASAAEAADALGAQPRRVFLTIGTRQLIAFAQAPQHHYLVRAIDAPNDIAALPDHRLILSRGPFLRDDEIELMRRCRIDALVAKNSGGRMTEAKLEAARALNLDVIMIERPHPQKAETFESVDEVLAWIEHHRPAP